MGEVMEKSMVQEVENRAQQVGESLARTTQAALSRAHEALSPRAEVNVGELERILSTLAGTALIARGLSRGSLLGLIFGFVGGGALLQRGLTGHCAFNSAIGRNSALSTGSWGGDGMRRAMQDDLRRDMQADESRGNAGPFGRPSAYPDPAIS